MPDSADERRGGVAEPLELDRSRCAIVVIECQNDLVHESRSETRGIGGALARAVRDRGILGRIAAVLDRARAAGVPVIYANKETKAAVPTGDAPIFRWSKRTPMLVEGSWGAQVHERIAPRAGDIVDRRFLGVDASYGSSLWGTLLALRRDHIVAMGVSTNFAVEGTVRGAVNRGFAVVVAEDCCASVPDDMHRFSVERILPLLASVTSSSAVCAGLQSDEG